jgi:hypothetical protein
MPLAGNVIFPINALPCQAYIHAVTKSITRSNQIIHNYNALLLLCIVRPMEINIIVKSKNKNIGLLQATCGQNVQAY